MTQYGCVNASGASCNSLSINECQHVGGTFRRTDVFLTKHLHTFATPYPLADVRGGFQGSYLRSGFTLTQT